MANYITHQTPPPNVPPPCQVEEQPKISQLSPTHHLVTPQFPSLPSWDTAANLPEQNIKQLVLNGQVPTAIADAGATSNCGVPSLVSTCVTYKIEPDPFISTGQKSDRIFRASGGQLYPADELKMLPFNIRQPANEVHMVPGFKNNLLSTSYFVDAGYAWLFDQDEVNIYDKRNTKITTSRAAVLKGWKLPEENLWRIPLLPAANKPGADVNERTATVAVSP